MGLRLDHVNLSVRNLEESIDWYHKIFGFESVESGITVHGEKWAIIAREDSMICMSEKPERGPASQSADAGVHRIFHFGLRIDDLEEWLSKIERLELTLLYGGEIRYPRSRSWYVRDPSGHEIEVSYAFGKPLRFPSHVE